MAWHVWTVKNPNGPTNLVSKSSVKSQENVSPTLILARTVSCVLTKSL